jgi:ABC-type nitrate/sulfonate/bicarbonate transport system permease component
MVLRAARSADTATSFAAIGAASGLAVLFFGLVRWLEDRAIGAWAGRS